ncbi:MAG: SMC family ATPase [Longimicrobiales bacterium]
MRPVRLQIEGFTSFRSPQEIDFSELDLFLITGATGSGKTSILDAVTLALYGNVPRTNKHELKELISLGASQAKVQLDFEVDRSLYRVARKLPKSGAQAATIERLEDGEPISEVDGSGVREANARIEEIVGLDYDAFTRAVLLPQGDFADFLKGDASERRNMLIRLLDLDRFIRVGKLAAERGRELDRDVSTTEELLQREYGEVGEEAIEEANEKAASLEERAATVEGTNREAKGCWETRQGLRRRLEALEELSSKLASHSDELERLSKLWGDLGERDPTTAAARDRATESRKAAEEDYREAKTTWQEVEKEVGDDALLAELAETAKTLAESEKTIQGSSGALERTEAEGQKLQEARQELAAELGKAQAEEQEAQEAVKQAAAAVVSARESLERANGRASLEERLTQERERGAELRGELDQAQAAEISATQTLEEATRSLAALETKHGAAAIRSHLQIGDDCPVCGAEIDELRETDAETELQIEAARSARADAERVLRNKGKSVSRLLSAIEGVAENVRRVEKDLEGFQDEEPIVDAEATLREVETQESRERANLKAAVQEARDALAQLSEHDQELARLDTKLSERRNHLADHEEKAKRCRARLVEVIGECPPSGYPEAISDRQARLREAAASLRVAEDQMAQARDAHEQAASARSALERELRDYDSDLRNQRSLLRERGETMGRIVEDAPPIVPPENSKDRAEALLELDQYRQTLERLANGATTGCVKELRRVETRVCTLLTDAEIDFDTDDLPVALRSLDQTARKVQVEAERSKDTLKLLRERLARKREMEGELVEKRKQARLHEKVAGELRRDRFISFLLDESFQDLALRASSELEQISDGRYSLAAEEDKFAVVDHANADERGSVLNSV